MPAYALRYARAFADAVTQSGESAEAIHQQLLDFVATLKGSRQLVELLDNPSVPVEQKISVLDRMKDKLQLSQLTRNLLAVVMRHDRILGLDEIVEDYFREIDSRLGVAEASVTTSRAIGEAERQQIEVRISDLTGKKVRTSFREDATLLGGAIVRIGSTVYDGSVLGQLERLKDSLITG